MGAITRVPLHAPRAAPGAVAQRVGERRNVGLALGLAWILVGGAIGVAAAGAHHPAALGSTETVAGVSAGDPVGSAAATGLAPLDDPATLAGWPGTVTTTTLMQPIPAFVGVDDPPDVGPPPAPDPAVARLLAKLLHEAKGSPKDPRPGAQALTALDFALAQVGRPYVWGAIGPDSYDCSGLTWRSYSQAGIGLSRVSADQYAFAGTPVSIAHLLPGDLVFFATASWDPGAVHHVGMYAGRGLMVDAPHTGAFVRVEPVTAAGYVGAVRVVPAVGETPVPAGKLPPVGPSSHAGPAGPFVPPPVALPPSTTVDSAPTGTGTSTPTDSGTSTPTDSGISTPSDSASSTPPDASTPTPVTTPTPTPPSTPTPTTPAPDPTTAPAPNPTTAPAPAPPAPAPPAPDPPAPPAPDPPASAPAPDPAPLPPPATSPDPGTPPPAG
jgi:NlpC/P60 family